MKKYYFLIIVTIILGLVLTGCSLLSNISQVPSNEQSGITYLTKHAEGYPFSTDLMAGGGNPASSTDVGDVLVWNDGDTLYAKYVINEAGWCLTETHLHVATSLDGIPQKNGNPPPGQFLYKGKHDCVTDYTYEIPLIWAQDTQLFIAAHAVVQKLSDVMTVTLASDTQTVSAGYTEIEPINPLNPGNYSGLATWSAAVPVSSPPIPPWVNPLVVLPGAVWVSSAATTEGGFGDQWRLFKEDFAIPSGAVNITGSLYMTADNAVEAYLNGTLVGNTGNVYGAAPSPQDYNFAQLWGPYTLTPLVGPNNLMFVVRNWVHTAYNPTGLTYKLDYEYQLLEKETAWAAGFDFPGANWATYFQYTLQTAVQLNLLPWGSTIPIETGSGKVMLYNPTGDPNFIVQVDLEGAQIDHTYVVWINADGADLSPLAKSPTPGSTWYTLGNLFTNGSGDGSFYIGVNLVYSGTLNNIEVALNEVSPYSNRKYSSELGTIVIN